MKGVSFSFSSRTNWDTEESAFAAEVRRLRSSGMEVFDLTISNPTVCGFEYDRRAILDPLLNNQSLVYGAEPFGMLCAREAVAGYYQRHGAFVDPGAVVLTTSTSEAYSYIFRLLCDAGDEVLIARPSYPLFDFLADLDDVRLRTYPLFYDFGWWIDFAPLESSIGPRTRAIVVVHPNNPTGHATSATERRRLEELCLRHGLALIVDEVFLDYGIGSAPITSFSVGPHPVLTFCLSGLSKIAGLPQMKVSWVTVFGPEPKRAEALRRLEVTADTFLSMNAPAQLALPHWLQSSAGLQAQIRSRVRENLEVLLELGLRVLQVEAGWSAIVCTSQAFSDEEPHLAVLHKGVLVHPGSFYGMSERNRVVVSLLVPTAQFRAGAMRMLAANAIQS